MLVPVLFILIKTNMVHNVVFVTKSVDIQTANVVEWLQKASVFLTEDRKFESQFVCELMQSVFNQ